LFYVESGVFESGAYSLTFWVNAWAFNNFASFKRLMLGFFLIFWIEINKFLLSFHFTFFVSNNLFGQSFSQGSFESFWRHDFQLPSQIDLKFLFW
jgi:hypothetical protein